MKEVVKKDEGRGWWGRYSEVNSRTSGAWSSKWWKKLRLAGPSSLPSSQTLLCSIPGIVSLFHSRAATLWPWIRIFFILYSPQTWSSTSLLIWEHPYWSSQDFSCLYFTEMVHAHTHTHRETVCKMQIKLRSSHKTTILSNTNIYNIYAHTYTYTGFGTKYTPFYYKNHKYVIL